MSRDCWSRDCWSRHYCPHSQLLLLLRRENYSLPFIIIIIIVITSVVVKNWIDPVVDNSTSNPEESWHAEVEEVLRDVNKSVVRLKDGLQVNRDVHPRNAAPSGFSGLFIQLCIWKKCILFYKRVVLKLGVTTLFLAGKIFFGTFEGQNWYTFTKETS